MSRFNAQLLLVGSVPLATAEEVFAACADELGQLVQALPDGETGYRSNWINYQAYYVHHPHPDLVTLQRPAPIGGVAQWSPHGFEDLWNFRLREGAGEVEFGDLFYAEQAIRSYVAFSDLRSAGRIPPDVRFQVSLPTPPGGIAAFFRASPDDYERVIPGYERAMIREVGKIAGAIPAGELAIQWDVCNEVMDNEGAYPWMPQDGRAWDRYLQAIGGIGSVVPEESLMGYHLCYGDLGGHHIVQPADLALLTRMANAAVAESRRPVDWIHMPVPVGRDDDAYFQPLSDLKAPESRLILGLIHPQDGVEGARRRLDAARRHAPGDISVSTECGFGRRAPGAVPPLLRLHREIADALLS